MVIFRRVKRLGFKSQLSFLHVLPVDVLVFFRNYTKQNGGCKENGGWLYAVALATITE